LILSGGGARAAYQVGVLMAIADIVPRDARLPFDIICGTSAGAINAAALASQAVHFRTGVRGLERIWSNLRAEQVYRTDLWSMLGVLWRWIFAGARQGESDVPYALLDSEPLRQLLAEVVNFKKIQRQVDNGHLYALSISASGYSTGENVSFYQGVPDIEPWRRARRVGIATRLQVDHLMASSALPLLFPAVRINREHFGDGAIRQLAPLSPALHLGARKILVIGVSGIWNNPYRRNQSDNYPTAAQIIGHVLNSAFIDAFEGDVERLERINRTLRLIPEEVRRSHHMELREIELLKIFPTRALDEIASEHVGELPRSIRLLFGGSGATRRGGGSAVSYLLFEPGFCRALMELGYHDAIARRDEIAAFLGQASPVGAASGSVPAGGTGGAPRADALAGTAVPDDDLSRMR
jgi:NTE family protein